MNIIRLAFELFLLYILYKFIFDFVIPVYRTSRQVKSKMREMQQRMQEQERAAQSRPAQPGPKPVKPTKVAGDYIDYEEVK